MLECTWSHVTESARWPESWGVFSAPSFLNTWFPPVTSGST